MVDRVLVIGGGVGGMSAAISLARRGIAVTLIDADPQWRVYGAGISLTGMSLRAFDDLGILDEVRARGFVGAGIRLRSVDGHVIMQSPVPEHPLPIQSSGGIMRPVLHDILSRTVREAGVEVRLGIKAVRMDDDGAGVDVTYSDGATGRYDLVVAAEGIFSDTRRMLFPETAAPRFTGQGCWRILAARPSHIDRTEMYVGAAVKLGINPVSPTEMYLFVLEHVPDNPRFAPEQQLAHLAGLLAPFGGDIPAVRASIGAASQVNYRPLEWMLLPAPWHKGRIVLIGDAAHATTPHMASGAGIAVEDGLVLAEEVAAHASVDSALAGFMARRFERARLVVENSVRIGEIEMAAGDQMPATMLMGDTMHQLQQPY
ncbi:FAD-dependent oxidoreductase [Sphingomonas sp. AR_OL41]|uniref:FAD-dependent oxidoreductase n=1 Tax=Sphingomonas sp. AR_OL41 TaxID=3042729 RepID=UPI00247FFAC5|nr:FAD-dependent oxidoreductase [Sphingomonas sp. AR_OL41]MDH7971932.1 FAD-dependent oxidoreductase [Sphingomonas sp. AR_OL41]